jgi:glycine betaine/choline ABC-type transport system substrate-binding protein
VLKRKPAPNVMEILREGYKPKGLIWLDSLGFENTFAMVVRREETGAITLSDAAKERAWRLGVGYEFATRPDGLPGLSSAYSLHLNGKVKTMDLGLLYQALNKKQVDMVAANSTDGMLSVLPLKVLTDDRHYFPPYECAIIVREQALREYAGLQSALRELSGRITADIMRRLNYELDGKHRPAREIAKDFLRSTGLER